MAGAPVGHITQRPSDYCEPLVAGIFAALEGEKDQEVADALILAMVQHIERTIPKEHQAQIARGVASALIANFE